MLGFLNLGSLNLVCFAEAVSKDGHHNRLKLTLIEHCDGTLFLGIHLGYSILNECKVVVRTLVNILAVAVIHKDCFINDFLKQTDDLSVGVRRFAFLLCSYLTDEVERLFSQFGRLNRIHISLTEREECEEFMRSHRKEFNQVWIFTPKANR